MRILLGDLSPTHNKRISRSKKLAIAALITAFALLIGNLFYYWAKYYQKSTIKSISSLEPEVILPVPVLPYCLDPQKILTSTEKALLLLNYSCLAKNTESLTTEPDLAKSWNYDIDTHTMQVHLRPEAYFQDGTPVIADDVIFSFHEWAKKDSLDSNLLFSIEGVEEYHNKKQTCIKGLKKINNLSIEIKLKHWTDNFIRILTGPRFVIFPKNYRGQTKAQFLRSPIGTGPYQLVSSNDKNYTYQRFPQYYSGKPLTNTIQINLMNEKDACAAFKKGRVNNLLFYRPSNAIDLINSNTSHFLAPEKSTCVLILSLADSDFINPSFRQYIVTKINIQKLISETHTDSLIANHIIPPGLIGSDTEPMEKSIPSSIDSLTKAMFEEKIKKLCIYIEDDTGTSPFRKALQDSLEKLGFRAKVAPLDEMYPLLLNDKLKIWIEGFGFKNEDPFNILQLFSQHSNEYLLVKPIPELQKIFDTLNNNLSPLERAQKYKQIDNYLTRNHFVLPLFQPNEFIIYNNKLKGVDFLNTAKFIPGWHKVYAEK